jgi:dimethylsulfone monooxygenase
VAARDASLTNRASFYNNNAFKLGLFGPNCSSGRTVTRVAERWSGNWADNLRLARMADAAGIDFLLPIGRWKGFGHETNFSGAVLETITWATGVLAKTERITAFATVHVPLIHPVVAAKQMMTADQISEGRFGLNVVVGWNEGEFEMFGIGQREHDLRYDYAQEWLDAVTRMWSSENRFDFTGRFFNLKDVRADPKPYGGTRPVMMNAGASPVGRDFAIRNCDALFTSFVGQDLAFDTLVERVNSVHERGRALGRDVDVYTTAIVTCRPTRQEAIDYYRHCTIEHADWSAVDDIMRMHVDVDRMTAEEREKKRLDFARGFGGYTILGDPDYVAGELHKLSQAGIRGVALSIVNYADELPYLCDEVLPRLARMGIREPVRA